jgi:hypothetical protein
VPASSPRPHARPGSGRAVRRKMTRGRVPGPQRPERVLSGRRARHALGQLARRGGLSIAGEPSPGAARRGVCGACVPSACMRGECGPCVPGACMRGVCGPCVPDACVRGACSRSPCSRSACDALASAHSADLRQSAARAPRSRAARERRALLRPHDGCCAGARGRASPAERLGPRPCRWPLASPLHLCRCLRARPGLTTLQPQRRQSRRPEYSAQRATEAGAHVQPQRTRGPG